MALITEGGIMPARAGDDPGDLTNYSFAVWIGSGIYKVKGADKRFAVVRAPIAYTLRDAQYDKAAFRDKLGFRLLLPALVAIEDETETDFTFGTAAFVPGLEVQIPVNQYWTLKPFGQFGAGKDTAGGDLQYIYGGGARSLVSFPWKKFKFGIGNSIILAEDRDSASDESNGFSMLEAGLDISRNKGKLNETIIGVFKNDCHGRPVRSATAGTVLSFAVRIAAGRGSPGHPHRGSVSQRDLRSGQNAGRNRDNFDCRNVLSVRAGFAVCIPAPIGALD
jgi:hypothetical protein